MCLQQLLILKVTDSTSSGTGNKSIASTAHGLLVGDAVSIPSGASNAIEKFSVSTVTDANTFVVDSNLTNAVTDVQVFKDRDLLKIQTGDGQSKVIVDKSGQLGIGNTAPLYRLDIADTEGIDTGNIDPTVSQSLRLGANTGAPTGDSNDIGPGIVWKPSYNYF